MASRPYNAAVFALYQISLLVGIVLLPIALVARQVGLRVPMDRVLDQLGSAYEDAGTNAS